MHLEPFSTGYYLGVAEVTGFGGNGAVMARDVYEDVEAQVYDRYSRFGLPIFVKLGRQHLRVRPEAGVPVDTLAVEDSILDVERIRAPETREVYVATESSAKMLVEWDDFLSERST